VPAERAVPPSRPASALKLLAYLVLLAAATAAAWLLVFGRPGAEHSWEAVAANAPGNTRVAFARARKCDAGICQTLWIGSNRETATLVSTLPGTERVDEIVWTNDGRRVGFLVNGYQLRLYDGGTLSPAGQFSLLTPDGLPSSRIARGVTFSENGRAVTFDDCPRARSGCRSGLVAVPQ
jgi:hypothetical protein